VLFLSLTIILFFPYKWFGAAVLVFGLDAAPKLFHRLSEAAFFGQAAGGCRGREIRARAAEGDFRSRFFMTIRLFRSTKAVRKNFDIWAL